MHPLLILTYIVNLMLLTSIFGVLGLFLGLLISGGVYFLMSKGAGDNLKYWSQILSIAVVHFLGIFAVTKAAWSTPTYVAIAIIMELAVVAIFSFIGKP